MEPKTTYAINADLLQAIVGLLNAMPAGQVRSILNAIEHTAAEQDKQRQQEVAAKALEQALAGKAVDQASKAADTTPVKKV